MRRLLILVSIAAAIAFSLALRARPAITPGLTAAASTAAVKPTIKITNFKFEPKELTVTAGTTVYWINDGNRHTVEADDGSFKSEVLKQGDKFEHTFTRAGSFPYHCEFHGEKGGKDMAGKIIVKAK